MMSGRRCIEVLQVLAVACCIGLTQAAPAAQQAQEKQGHEQQAPEKQAEQKQAQEKQVDLLWGVKVPMRDGI